MPEFIVGGIDGRKYRVTAPEGETQDDANRFLWRQQEGIEPEAPSFMASVGRGMMDLAQGVKQLGLNAGEAVGLADEGAADEYTRKVNEEIELYERGRQGKGFDWGRLTGNVAGSAPAMVLTGGSALPATMAGRIGIGAATGAGLSGLQYSKENSLEDRMTSAAIGGAIGGALPAGGAVLKRTLMGLKPATPAAAQMIKDGIPLTPGMMRGGVLQAAEQKLANVPLIGGGIRARQREALTAWNKKLMQDVMPEGQITAAGQKGMQELTDAFTTAYGKLWNRSVPLSVPELESSWAQLAKQVQNLLPAESSARFNSQLGNLLKNELQAASADGLEVAGNRLSFVDDELRKAASAAGRRGAIDEAKAFGAARTQMRQLMPMTLNNELAKLDGLYSNFARLRKASSYVGAGRQGGTFTPAQLQTAATTLDRSAGKGATARGTAPMQPQAQEAAQVLGDTGSTRMGQAVGTGALGAAAYMEPHAISAAALGRGLYTRPVQNWITGRNPAQSLVRDWAATNETQALLKALRNYGRPAPILAPQQEESP